MGLDLELVCADLPLDFGLVGLNVRLFLDLGPVGYIMGLNWDLFVLYFGLDFGLVGIDLGLNLELVDLNLGLDSGLELGLVGLDLGLVGLYLVLDLGLDLELVGLNLLDLTWDCFVKQ